MPKLFEHHSHIYMHYSIFSLTIVGKVFVTNCYPRVCLSVNERCMIIMVTLILPCYVFRAHSCYLHNKGKIENIRYQGGDVQYGLHSCDSIT
jgi:hypothetical protein